jgi:adenylyltransferase/sulfurtransferase
MLFFAVYFVCRRGNDSQIAVRELKEVLTRKDQQTGFEPIIKDITGGLHAWAKTVDNNFPVY